MKNQGRTVHSFKLGKPGLSPAPETFNPVDLAVLHFRTMERGVQCSKVLILQEYDRIYVRRHRAVLQAGFYVGKCETCLKNCSDRKSTRLNSSHVAISYAVFCLKK